MMSNKFSATGVKIVAVIVFVESESSILNLHLGVGWTFSLQKLDQNGAFAVASVCKVAF